MKSGPEIVRLAHFYHEVAQFAQILRGEIVYFVISHPRGTRGCFEREILLYGKENFDLPVVICNEV